MPLSETRKGEGREKRKQDWVGVYSVYIDTEEWRGERIEGRGYREAQGHGRRQNQNRRERVSERESERVRE